MGDGAVGYRFHPTDEELISHYLRNKMLGNLSLVRSIKEIDFYKCEPWDLPAQSAVRSNDQVWYFFCARDYKYSNSKRANRTTKCGFWKVTGKDRKIKAKGTNREIGTKKTLVFYEGRVPGIRTNWVKHEYHLTETPPNQSAYVICKLKKKAGEKIGISSGNGDELSYPMHTDFVNVSERNTPSEENPQIQETLDSLVDYTGLDRELALQSLIYPEEGLPLVDLQYSNDFSGNIHNVLQSQLDTTELEQQFVNSVFADQDESPCKETVYTLLSEQEQEFNEQEQEFVNSMFADQDESACEETVHTLLNDYRPPESLRGVYLENSSDTDAEMSYTRHGRTLETSSRIGGPGSSKAHKQMYVKNVFHCDDIRILDSDSGESAKDGHFTNNRRQLPMEQCSVNLRTRKSEGKFINMLTQEGPEELQLQLKANEAASRNKAREVSERIAAVKKISIKDFEKEKKNSQETNGETSKKSRSHGSTSSNRNGSLIFMETTQISHKPSPPSVYLRNVIVGVVLFIFCVWEVAFFHSRR